MPLCEFNGTIGVPTGSKENNPMVSIEDDRLYGYLGGTAQKVIESRKNYPYLCKIIGFVELGKKTSNGSYDGGFGLLENRQIDLVLKSIPAPFIDIDLFQVTPAANSEAFYISHQIDEKFVLDDSKFILAFFDLNFMGHILVTCLILLFSIFIISLFLKTSNFFEKFKSILNSIDELDRSNPLYIIILSVSFTIFTFLSQQVIVDTSSLITTEKRLFDSDRKIIWPGNELDLEYAKNAKEGTFLYKIYKYKNYNPPLILKEDFVKKFTEEGFIFRPETNTEAENKIAMFFPNVKTFINPEPYLPQPNFLARNKGNNKKTKHIDNSITWFLENGINIMASEEAKRIKYFPELIKKSSKIYRSVDEYINDYDFTVQLNLENYYYLFLSLFIISLISFLLFSIHHLIVIIYKNRKKIRYFIKNRLLLMRS